MGKVCACKLSHPDNPRNAGAIQNVAAQRRSNRANAIGLRLCNGERVIANTAIEAEKNTLASKVARTAQAVPRYSAVTMITQINIAETTTGNRVHALPNQSKNSALGVAGVAPFARASRIIIW